MEKHEDSKNYLDWCLENTARLLGENFPQSHVLVVRPSRVCRRSNAALSCFDNFVRANEYGVPTFCASHRGLSHLAALVAATADRIAAETNVTDYQSNQYDLMGFSKGCTVLNQLLYELSEPKVAPTEFVKRIDAMWWLDSGHCGVKDTWITDERILESITKLGIKVRIRLTPYQIEDDNRPWIRREEQCFRETLQRLGGNVDRQVYFKEHPRNLETHFKLLSVVRDS